MNSNCVATARLFLRPFRTADLARLAEINSDPEVMRYTGNGNAIERAETEKRLHSYIDHWQKHEFGLWAVTSKADQLLIGFCGLQFVHGAPEIEIGFRLAKKYWGSGLATEAGKASLHYGFNVLALDRIVGLTQPANIASQRVLEKIGLTYEREAWFYETTVMYYSIRRGDYAARHRR